MFSQKLGTPLEPQAAPLQTEAGIIFGLGNNFQTGIYYPKCEDCQFEDAQGLGITVGGVFIRDIKPYLQYGATLTFNSLSANTSYQKTEEVKVWNKAHTFFEIRPIPFRNTAEFGLGEIVINPFIQWLPLKFMFFRLGFGASVLADKNFKQEKELLKFIDTLSGGEIVDLEILNDNPIIETVEDRKIPGINPFRISLEPTLGFTFEISNQIILNPSFTYSIPLSKLSSLQNDFNINRWRILFELRLAIKLRNIKIN
ncbi:MAG: hypothetical protein V1779_16355 [bacterium]